MLTTVTTPPRRTAAAGPRRPVIAPAPIAPERDARRDRRHLLLALVGWALAGLGWVRALEGATDGRVALPALVVAASLLLCVAITTAWVAHNRRIYREKGPRTALPTARIDYRSDWVGRPVTTEWSLAQGAQELVIVSGDGWKAVWPARTPGGRAMSSTPRR